MHRLSRILAPVALILSCSVEAAGQTVHDNYFEALPLFWQQVYAAGGETLYCSQPFGRSAGREINIEHVYPMSWAMRAVGCYNRDECRRTSRRFNQIESDMHNFYPARKDINKIRGSYPFGVIKGEARSFGQCDFEIDARQRIVEPPPASRGNIARAMFHMKESYGLKIFPQQGLMLQRWNREDPPNDEELRRNNVIEKLQGTRNRFIDEPRLAEKLRF
ncbi:MAG: endonuclease [Chromatiaceae bacterium]|nr:endonuclease [Gammaproteobacteria bacterium]MCB1860820.1 endonuclease [Gammaproteobacteria bacterium]MCB1881016.1 endonuclease [Gammaproteobacteria bacterium]MCP5427987.1 endonuclease [Chromatiaceae bacterium]MCP5447237.1 endonuclease [Chromatiaceae bacterium]